jgi:hypothetical protein
MSHRHGSSHARNCVPDCIPGSSARCCARSLSMSRSARPPIRSKPRGCALSIPRPMPHYSTFSKCKIAAYAKRDLEHPSKMSILNQH